MFITCCAISTPRRGVLTVALVHETDIIDAVKSGGINKVKLLDNRFTISRAFPVCKMLKVPMLQSLELINSVETGHFSTEFVEKPNVLRRRRI
jgi:hypothetical protein